MKKYPMSGKKTSKDTADTRLNMTAECMNIANYKHDLIQRYKGKEKIYIDEVMNINYLKEI